MKPGSRTLKAGLGVSEELPLSSSPTLFHTLSPNLPFPQLLLSHTLSHTSFFFFFFEHYPNSGLRPPYLHTFSGQKLQVSTGQGAVQTKGTLQVDC